ncbi:MAG: ATP-binding protein, partial [Planctomycetes bacterium]|nr:ATP-binding protein [Planctomycetota bacterium]
YPGRPGRLGWLPVEDPGRNGVDHPVGGHPARQGADVAVFEGPLGPEGDLDGLFAVGGHVRAVHGDVEDAEPDLGLGPAWAAASNTVTFGEHLLSIINDILDLSKIEVGKITIEAATVFPLEVVAELFDLMEVRARDKGLRLRATCNGPVPATISSDPLRLRQILVNLVGNAIKFTEVGGVEVRISTDVRAQLIHFDVVDTGIGLPPSALVRIFDAFTQADGSITRRFGGTGLGLRISQRLAQMLGGEIRVASKLGAGSTFTATVATGPLADVRWIETGMSVESHAGARDAGAHGPPPQQIAGSLTLSGVRVLLVEDGPDNARLIAHHLGTAGATVQIASNGRHAIEALTSDHTDTGPLADPSPFDMVVTDMQMPEIDGYTLARTLRTKGFSLPIVALTAHAMSGEHAKCREAGCDAYASKPIDKHRLIEICRTALQVWRRKQILAALSTAGGQTEPLVEVRGERRRVVVAAPPASP